MMIKVKVDMICTLNNKSFQMEGDIEKVVANTYLEGEQTPASAEDMYPRFFGSFVALANQPQNRHWYAYVSTENVKCTGFTVLQ